MRPTQTRCSERSAKRMPNIRRSIETTHGVLADVFGVGVLILGRSGAGKSETALELIRRGHRLVADDLVELSRTGRGVVTGRAPTPLRRLLEVRGLGIVDVRALFGPGAVRERITVSLVVQLEAVASAAQNSGGLSDGGETRELLGVRVPCFRLASGVGRNLASLIEVGARSTGLRNRGRKGIVLLPVGL